MHIDNEYERLVKEGYIEAGTLVIRVDDITKLELSSEEVKPEDVKQAHRQDKTVVVIDKEGRMKKISSLMFGYNKSQVKLADGSFANADELLTAMQEAISKLDQGSFVIDKKGKVLNPIELLSMVEEAAGKVRIGARSSAITNQDSRYWSVTGAKSNIEHRKGIAFLGNKGIKLPSGDYVSLDELLIALNDYMVMKPGLKPIPPVTPNPIPTPTPKPHTESKPVVVRVVRKYKNQLSRLLALLAALMVLLSGFRLRDNVKIVDIPIDVQTQIVQLVEQEQLSYLINGLETEYTYESISEAQKRIISDYKIGDEVQLEDGDELYANSMLSGSRTIIGQGIRQAGNYQISGVSIVYQGQIYAFNVDLNIENPGFVIGDFINETCSKYNLDLDQVEIRLHIGNSSNYTRTGWIDLSKLIKEDSIDQQIVSETLAFASTYEGSINNFQGSIITIETLNGPVQIKVVDNDGHLLPNDTIVVGSDGQEYKIGGLELTTSEAEKEITETSTVMVQQQVVDGKKLTWRVQDCSLAIVIATLLGSILAARATKKKNEEASQNPQLFEFENEEEYQKFKADFIEAKKRYDQKSGFKKMLRDLFYRKETDLLQRLTEEQIEKLYTIIRNWHDGDYTYQPDDHIEFKNGRIVITFKDGRTQDITDIVMPEVATIGANNPYEAEGLLEEESKDGIRRR